MATIYIGCYQETQDIVQATKIPTGKQHRVEVFTSYDSLLYKISDETPHVLLLPLYFKSVLTFIDVIDRIGGQLRAHGCQIGMFAIMKPDGEPSLSWQMNEIHNFLLAPYTPWQIFVSSVQYTGVKKRQPASSEQEWLISHW